MSANPRPRNNRSKVTNGTTTFLPGVDEQSSTSRLFKDIVAEAEAERGGRAALTVAQRQAVRAFAAISVEMHRIEADATATGRELPEVYGVLCDRANRQVSRMGPVKPTERLTPRQYAERYRAGKDKR